MQVKEFLSVLQGSDDIKHAVKENFKIEMRMHYDKENRRYQ